MKIILLSIMLLTITLVGADSWNIDVGDGDTSTTWGVNVEIPEEINYSEVETVNSSEIWITNAGNLDDVNLTQIENSGGELNIKESWIDSFGDGMWLKLDGSNANQNINIGSNDFTTTGDITASNLKLTNSVTGAIPYMGTNTVFTFDDEVLKWDLSSELSTILDFSTVGNFKLNSDSSKYFAGVSEDISFFFDGSNAFVNAEVGSPNLSFTNFDNYEFDNININGNSITSDTGTILFGNEILTTTGKINCDGVSSTDYIVVSGTTQTSGQLARLVKTNYNLNTATATQSGLYASTRASTGGTRALYSLQFDNRYTGSGTQSGSMIGCLGQVYNSGSGNTGLSAGYQSSVYNANDGTATAMYGFTSLQLANLNTKTGTITTAIEFMGNGIDAEDGTVTNAYGFYSAPHRVDSGTLTRAYGIRLLKQTAGSSYNWQLYSDGGNMFMGNDNSIAMWGTTTTDLRISSDGTNGIIDVGTALRLGNDVTNYAEVKADGEINLHGTARVTRHLRVGAPNWKGYGVNAPTENTEGVFFTTDFDNTADDEVWYSLLVPSRWDTSTDIEFVVDWFYDGTQDDGTVCWGLEYKGIKAGESVTGAGTTITKTSTGTHTTGQMVRTTFTTKILATNLEEHDTLGLKLYRDVSADTLGTDARIVNTHFHFIQNKLGDAT